jgi:hypothetical protein
VSTVCECMSVDVLLLLRVLLLLVPARGDTAAPVCRKADCVTACRIFTAAPTGTGGVRWGTVGVRSESKFVRQL